MSDIIQDNKLVELTYKVTDQASGQVLTSVEFPLGYIHGQNDVLAPQVLEQLEGKSAGDIIEVPIDCNLLYGARDEALVFTDRIENVPEEYREIGTTITMENDKGKKRNFIVTKIDDETLTVDATIRSAADTSSSPLKCSRCATPPTKRLKQAGRNLPRAASMML